MVFSQSLMVKLVFDLYFQSMVDLLLVVKQSLEFANFFIGASCFISKIRSLMRAFSKII